MRNIKSNYYKFLNEVKEHGFDSALSRVNYYLYNKIRMFKLSNLVSSSKVAFSENDIIVNWSVCAEITNNFGDALNPILVSNLTNNNFYNYRDIINVKKKPVYSVTGSILDDSNINNLEIWGSGFMYETGTFKTFPQKVHAVRGPLTRKLIKQQGLECPEIYGDPGLLIPKIYDPNIKKEYKLGIIPHLSDKNNKYIISLKNKYSDAILIIDIQDTFYNVIDNIKKCDFIASSSLHGVITADAYNIPSLWIKLSDRVSKFKFRDYMLSVNRKQMKPVIINKEYSLNELLNDFNNYKINIDLNKLLASCPFKEFDLK